MTQRPLVMHHRSTWHTVVLVLAYGLAFPLFGSSITDASFNPASSPFSTNLITTYGATQANISGGVSCDSLSPCTGAVGTFSLSLTLTDVSTPASIDISGTNSGPATEGVLVLNPPFSQTDPFPIAAVSFSDLLLSTSFPELGAVTVTGTLDLSLAPGQTLVLPLTFGIEGSAVPEPSVLILVLLGVMSLAGKHYLFGRDGNEGVLHEDGGRRPEIRDRP